MHENIREMEGRLEAGVGGWREVIGKGEWEGRRPKEKEIRFHEINVRSLGE